jgi:hypothetical protein
MRCLEFVGVARKRDKGASFFLISGRGFQWIHHFSRVDRWLAPWRAG